MSDTRAQTQVGVCTSARQPPEQAEERWCPIIELRQYIHQPGLRDDFIALFDEHFIEEQERYGAHIIGQFRDRNHPDQFVWLRGFPDMQTRHTALEGFYHSSPIWGDYTRRGKTYAKASSLSVCACFCGKRQEKMRVREQTKRQRRF